MKKTKKRINYKAIYFTGIVFLGVGVTFLASENSGIGAAIIGLGALCMLIGGKNKDKWKKN